MPLSFYLLFSISLFKIDRGISLQNNFIIHSFLLPYDISCLLIFEIRLSLYNLYYSFKSFFGGAIPSLFFLCFCLLNNYPG